MKKKYMLSWMGSIYFIYMSEQLSSSQEVLESSLEINPERQKAILSSFEELFRNPDFVAKLQTKIQNLWDPVQEKILSANLNHILRHEDDIEKVHTQTHARLDRLMDTIQA